MNGRVLYNEIDPFAAAWLRNLVAAGYLPPGDVDQRDIRDISPADLAGYSQCHFFAGIGVWAYALRQAGWPDDQPVWTGSCPCQPFSAAGRGAGFDDERHLWPAWHWLISECRPPTVLGEQVAGDVAGPWIDLVSTDLEALGYAFGAVSFPACSVGAPHIRQRLYWMADAGGEQRQGERLQLQPRRPRQAGAEAAGSGKDGLLGDADNPRPQGRRVGGNGAGQWPPRSAGVASFWSDADWISCQDGKARPVEPGTFPLAHGAPARVGRLRGYGNAINAEQAAAFIQCAMSITPP